MQNNDGDLHHRVGFFLYFRNVLKVLLHVTFIHNGLFIYVRGVFVGCVWQLAPGRKYVTRVRARNHIGESGWSPKHKGTFQTTSL
eukprot:COSAG02_NODE_3390_length_6822_cov_7.140860_9_plen_85_part_00